MKQRDPQTGKFVRTTPDYKAMYLAKCEEAKSLNNKMADLSTEYAKLAGKFENLTYRVAYLYEHATFWRKCLYRREFEKG
jgi:hypothetical protein